MKTKAGFFQSLILVLFYGLCYSVSSVLLDVALTSHRITNPLRDLVEYFVYFLMLYSLPTFLLVTFYKFALPSATGRLWIRILAGFGTGLFLGLLFKKINVSFYIGEYRLFKSMLLFACCNVVVILIDHFAFKSPNYRAD